MSVRQGPSQLRRYSDDDPLTHGVSRGALFFDALARKAALVSEGRLLVDIGCGYGGLSLAWANRGGRAVALDTGDANLRVLRTRLDKDESGLARLVYPTFGSALAIPLPDATVDYALMSGVVEWVGYSQDRAEVRSLQLQALREAARVLKPGGTLFIGTKNRLFPRYFWRDAQVGLPLLNAMPRSAADWLCRRFRGHGYRAYIYSYWGWKGLLAAAGLSETTVMVPLFTYQYPIALVQPWTSIRTSDAMRSLDQLEPGVAKAATVARTERTGTARSAYYAALGRAGLLGFGAGSFLLVSRKMS